MYDPWQFPGREEGPVSRKREMSDSALQRWVEEVSERDFGKPFRHTARFNHRLRTTGGRYFPGDHRIEINPAYLEAGEETVLGIIRHELCHYHLHLDGKDFRHRSSEFRKLLARVGGLRYAPPLPGMRKSLPVRYALICLHCGQIHYRKRKMDPRRYRCGACGGPLALRELK